MSSTPKDLKRDDPSVGAIGNSFFSISSKCLIEITFQSQETGLIFRYHAGNGGRQNSHCKTWCSGKDKRFQEQYQEKRSISEKTWSVHDKGLSVHGTVVDHIWWALKRHSTVEITAIVIFNPTCGKDAQKSDVGVCRHEYDAEMTQIAPNR